MNEIIKSNWVAALRSKKYIQGRRALAADGKHCCLGVLCELAAEAGIVNKDDSQWATSFDGQSSLLPPSVTEWAGLEDRRGIIPGGVPLSFLNDSGAPFEEIARIIEERL